MHEGQHIGHWLPPPKSTRASESMNKWPDYWRRADHVVKVCAQCGEHRVYNDGLCYRCFGESYEQAVRQRQLQAWQRDIDFRLAAAGMDSKYIPASFAACDDHTPSAVKDQILSWAKSPKGMLYVWGPIGSGKTFLAAAAMREWMMTNDGARWIFVPEMFSLLKAGMDGKRSGWDETQFRQLFRVPFLVVDDIGAELSGPWQRATIALLIAQRYNADQPTLITSNLSLPEMVTAIDDRTVSRIIEAAPTIRLLLSDRRAESARARQIQRGGLK